MHAQHLAALLLCCAIVLAAPVGAHAQEVRIEGRVIANETEEPVPHAGVTIQRHYDSKLIERVETDADGRFRAEIRGHEAVKLRVERLGYTTTVTPTLHFDDRNYFQVEVRLDTDAVVIAPLEVVVWGRVDPSPLLDNFRRRLDRGQGIYITRAEIENRRPMFMSDMLRTVPGVVLEGSGVGNRPRISIGRSAGMRCSTQIFVDGMLMSRAGADVRLDDLVSPASVEGIEIYRGLSTVPAEFLNPDAGCGVIAVWTRRGGRGAVRN